MVSGPSLKSALNYPKGESVPVGRSSSPVHTPYSTRKIQKTFPSVNNHCSALRWEREMDARSFPDWGKVGRRIGKKLRDILNPPTDNGPSKEERKAQRIHDAHKGFAYFDTFEELLQWSTEDVDLKQQANTPLLARSASAVHDQTSPSTKLMICHDYSGGYHDYESARPGPLPNELYNCVYLQYVDTFIYFSHKLACCPPAAWTNLLHRNGVKVLGTFVVEPQTPGMEGVLEIVDGEYIVAKQLASIARMLGFDGWLLNIEQEFPDDVEDLTEKLVAFIRSLKSGLGPNDLVVWYDALTTVNEVEYQNSLSLKNAPFARAADRLFTNYKWTPRHLKPTRVEANHQGIETSNIHFGIDVWAQNTNMPGPARITYPAKGGGGTNTGTVGLSQDTLLPVVLLHQSLVISINYISPIYLQHNV